MINKIANITFKSTQEDTSHKTRLNSNLAVTGACSGLTTIGLGECFNKFDIAEFSKNNLDKTKNILKYSTLKNIAAGIVLGVSISTIHKLLSQNNNQKSEKIAPIDSALLTGTGAFAILEIISKNRFLNNLNKTAVKSVDVMKKSTLKNAALSCVFACTAGYIHKISAKQQ